MNNDSRFLPKGSTLLRGCWFWSKKLHFQKNFGRNFIAVEGVSLVVKSAEPKKISCPQVPGSIPAENMSTQIHMDLSK